MAGAKEMRGGTVSQARGGTQTTLDSYRWADSMLTNQEVEGNGTNSASGSGDWDEQYFNEFIGSLETMTAKACQQTPNPSQ